MWKKYKQIFIILGVVALIVIIVSNLLNWQREQNVFEEEVTTISTERGADDAGMAHNNQAMILNIGDYFFYNYIECINEKEIVCPMLDGVATENLKMGYEQKLTQHKNDDGLNINYEQVGEPVISVVNGNYLVNVRYALETTRNNLPAYEEITVTFYMTSDFLIYEIKNLP